MRKFYTYILIAMTITLGILFYLDAPINLFALDLSIFIALMICYPIGLDDDSAQ